MAFNFLTPVSDWVLNETKSLSPQAMRYKIRCHSLEAGMPDLEGVNVAIIGVPEHRNKVNYTEAELNFDTVRMAFYAMFPGNWSSVIADLGDILPGNSVEDTYFALRTTIAILIEKQIIPIVIGGSQDLTYANFRAYDNLIPMINMVNVDSCFDLGDASMSLKNNSYLGKIILEEPYNLFNYSVLGYQTYYNSQEERDLLERLYFEGYRIGDVSSDISLVEPIMRDAHIVTLDLKALKASELGPNQGYSPNGFTGREICAIARYAGISNKLTSFGIYEFNQMLNSDGITPMMVSQIIWYFVEGINCRIKDDDFKDKQLYQKYNVLIEDHDIVFYKSIKTGRWWMEIPFLEEVNNKLKRHTLLPCNYNDYLVAVKGEVPERWFKAFKKNLT
jgi:arginase family enzyme